MAWIELHQSVWTHRKTLLLATALNLDETYAAAHLARLWTWALDNAPDGALTGLPASVIAYGAGWKGDADLFFGALVSTGWLTRDGDNLALHDWWDYAGRLIEKRQANAERMRKARATHVQNTCNARAGATVPNRTQPYPTSSSSNVQRTCDARDGNPQDIQQTPGGQRKKPAEPEVTTAATFTEKYKPAGEISTPLAIYLQAFQFANPVQQSLLEKMVAEVGEEIAVAAVNWAAAKPQPDVNAIYSCARAMQKNGIGTKPTPMQKKEPYDMGKLSPDEYLATRRNFTNYGGTG